MSEVRYTSPYFCSSKQINELSSRGISKLRARKTGMLLSRERTPVHKITVFSTISGTITSCAYSGEKSQNTKELVYSLRTEVVSCLTTQVDFEALNILLCTHGRYLQASGYYGKARTTRYKHRQPHIIPPSLVTSHAT